MAKITAENRELFTEKSKAYKELTEKILEREKNTLTLSANDTAGMGYKRLLLSEEMMYIASVYIIINNLSVEILGVKNEDALNDSRKAIYKAIIYLEEIVSNIVDASFSEYEDRLQEITNTPLEKRYHLVRKLGLTIQLMEDAYGDNTKWKWSFVEVEGRFATVAKNLMNMKNAGRDAIDPQSPDYDITIYYLRLIKKLHSQVADAYRNKYELTTKRLDDMRLGINYLLALRRLQILTNEREEAEETKRKALTWRNKMDEDVKRAEAARKSK
ncbi:MAG: hypothetical protein LBR47_01735 [Spirochaetaceae bacterium]|jgi:hypothetical protein|nr:hypothetical protein [Spirochaetaceae bacterium]